MGFPSIRVFRKGHDEVVVGGVSNPSRGSRESRLPPSGRGGSRKGEGAWLGFLGIQLVPHVDEVVLGGERGV